MAESGTNLHSVSMTEEAFRATPQMLSDYAALLKAHDALAARLADVEAEHAAFSNNVEQCEAENDKLVARLAEARGALADIAHSHDMTMETARAKAKRVYEATADSADAAKE